MTADEFAVLMTQRGYRVKAEAGGYRCPCPAHGGDDPNMTIRSHAEGGVVCTCHSHHCSRQDIAKALGLKMTDLVAGDQRAPATQTIYAYRDESGAVLFEVVREDRPGEKKKIWQRLPGQEKGSLGDVRRVLYGLPRLLASPPRSIIGIAEGEKCVDALLRAGIVATTNCGGADKWRKEYTDWLKANLADRRFIIFPDNDEPGIKHAEAVFHSLRHAGLSARVALLEGLTKGGDVADWLQSHSAEELRDVCDPRRQYAAGEVDAADLLNTHFEPLKWAIKGVLPEGLAIFAGPSKSCKSWLCCEIGIAMVTGGKVFGQIECERGDVLYLALEDSPRRLKDRIATLLRGEALPRGLTLRTEADQVGAGCEDMIEDWLSRHPAARLVIVDVLQKVRPPKEKGVSEYEQDYQVLTSLHKLCKEHRVAMLIVHHTRKMKAEDPYDMISGSTAIQGAADTIMALMRTRGDEDATLHYTGRDVDSEALAIRWDSQECGWRLLGKAKDCALSAERRKILEFLSHAKTDAKPGEIAAVIGKQTDAVQYLLRKLLDEGYVTRSHAGHYCMTPIQIAMMKTSE